MSIKPMIIATALITAFVQHAVADVIIDDSSYAGQDFVTSDLVLRIEPGAVIGSATLSGGGSVTGLIQMVGGSIDGDLVGDLGGSSSMTIQIAGGSVGGSIESITAGSSDGTIEIYGDQLSGSAAVVAFGGGFSGDIKIYGSGFAIDGTPVAFGNYSSLPAGTLTGTLANGDALSLTWPVFLEQCIGPGGSEPCFNEQSAGALTLIEAGLSDIPQELLPSTGVVSTPASPPLLISAVIVMIARYRAQCFGASSAGTSRNRRASSPLVRI